MARNRKNGNGKELSILNEVLGLMFLFFTLFSAFSLASYQPADPSFFQATASKTVLNYGGRLGAELSALLFNLFGLVSFWLLPVMLFLSVFFFLNRRISSMLTKSIGFVLVLFSSAAFLAGVKPVSNWSGKSIESGGIVGLLLHRMVSAQIKDVFTALLFFCLLIIGFSLSTRFSLRKALIAVWQFLQPLLLAFGKKINNWWKSHRKKTSLNKIRKKYQEDMEVTAAKSFTHDSLPEKEKKTRKSEIRDLARVPSRLPEEGYLFDDLKPVNAAVSSYQSPPLSFLDAATAKSNIDYAELEEKKEELKQRLQEFRINGEIVEYTPGPVVTTFEFVPDIGVKVKDVSNLTEDLALVVKAQYVRIERILGKKAIGIEIPNRKREIIHLRELLESQAYIHSGSPLTLALGKSKSGEIFLTDLCEMPHLIIAGATGSGKSVAIHSIILSIVFKSPPSLVKFILIDPKRIELAIYNSLPHLLTPVVVQPKLAKNALDWAVVEMENRYRRLALLQVRNIEQYNKKIALIGDDEEDEDLQRLDDREPLPYIVIIIDELADLMMVSAREIEENIARIAQKARAVGIHLILATQRPSIDVITGTIKNNFPSRIALAVPSKHDSRTIIDVIGAEKLLGNGDMLFLPPKTASLIRLHGAYVSEEEAMRVVSFLAKKEKPRFNTQIVKQISNREDKSEESGLDDLFLEAAETVVTTGQASASYLQRRLSIGYARAGRLMDQLEARGIVSTANSKNQREILITVDELRNLLPDNSDQEI